VPPWEIRAINFNQMPWRRYLNYPTKVSFYCPACGRITRMHVMMYDIPGTGGDNPEYD
jgi:hypothetical protein